MDYTYKTHNNNPGLSGCFIIIIPVLLVAIILMQKVGKLENSAKKPLFQLPQPNGANIPSLSLSIIYHKIDSIL